MLQSKRMARKPETQTQMFCLTTTTAFSADMLEFAGVSCAQRWDRCFRRKLSLENAGLEWNRKLGFWSPAPFGSCLISFTIAWLTDYSALTNHASSQEKKDHRCVVTASLYRSDPSERNYVAACQRDTHPEDDASLLSAHLFYVHFRRSVELPPQTVRFNVSLTKWFLVCTFVK